MPNATISWWYRDLEIGREDLDKNYEILGHGPLSILRVSPLAGKYYGHYTCKAENIYDSAQHKIELIQAHEPTQIQQAVLDKITSTTLQFRFVPPTNIGGLPLDAYAVEYKETRHLWNQAKRRVWPIGKIISWQVFIMILILKLKMVNTFWKTCLQKQPLTCDLVVKTVLDSLHGVQDNK